MENTLRLLNDLEASGVVVRYAIGGATGLLFYTEPMLTYDLDVFCVFRPEADELVSLTPVYDFLRAKGAEISGEHVIVAGIPVQFLPAHNALLLEAVQQAATQHFRGVPTRVFRYEHLLAVMVQTGRKKDRARLLQALDERPPEEGLLRDILTRHNLLEAWARWKELP